MAIGPALTQDQNLLPVQAYFNVDGSFNTFIGQGQPFYATSNPVQSGLSITNSTINSTTIGATTPSTGAFTDISTTTGTITTNATGATDIVNLLTLQSYAVGISWKAPVTAATTVNITLSGLQTVDTVSLVAGNTVLVKNQTNSAQNGIYTVSSGAWTYATGCTTWSQYVSALVFVEYGGQAGSAWYCTAQPGGTLGTTAMTWSNFSTAANYTAGTGLTLSGYQFSITNTGVAANTYGSATATPVFAVNAQGQITSVTNTTITPAIGSVTGLATGMATFLQTPTSANLAATVTDETGSGALVFANGPTLIAPALGTPTSGTVTNLTGTASININGTVGATTRYSGDFTTLSGNSVTSTTPVLSFNASNTIASFGSTTSGSYNQLVIQNKSTSAGASSNYVISNDLGTDSTYYGEFGMNSSIFSASTPADFFSINNGVYFSGHDGDITVGSGNGYKHYFAWGTTGQSAHVINASGAIGLSTNLGTTPATSGTTGYGTSGQVLTSAGSSAAPTWTTPTTGTVTSVSFTGGIISVANSTTTPALTVAGTSGGIPYFSSGTTWASSAALTQYGIVYGGGAGAAPVATAAGTTGQVLLANTSAAPTWGQVSLTAGVTGTLPVGNGGTGVATLSGLAYGNATSAFTAATAAQVVAVIGSTAVSNATTATNATNVAITDNTSSSATWYPILSSSNTGNQPATTSSTKLSFVPSTGVLTATSFAGSGANLTGVITSLTAGTGVSVSGSTINATGSTINSQTSGYTLVAGDAGKTISITTGGVTVPASVLSAGNIVTIYNNSGSSQTITQGTSLTLQWAGQSSSTTGNRTLGLYGMATLVYISSTVAVITGAGLS